MYVCVYVCTHAYMYVYTYICITYMHIHTYNIHTAQDIALNEAFRHLKTCVCVCVCVCVMHSSGYAVVRKRLCINVIFCVGVCI